MTTIPCHWSASLRLCRFIVLASALIGNKAQAKPGDEWAGAGAEIEAYEMMQKSVEQPVQWLLDSPDLSAADKDLFLKVRDEARAVLGELIKQLKSGKIKSASQADPALLQRLAQASTAGQKLTLSRPDLELIVRRSGTIFAFQIGQIANDPAELLTTLKDAELDEILRTEAAATIKDANAQLKMKRAAIQAADQKDPATQQAAQDYAVAAVQLPAKAIDGLRVRMTPEQRRSWDWAIIVNQLRGKDEPVFRTVAIFFPGTQTPIKSVSAPADGDYALLTQSLQDGAEVQLAVIAMKRGQPIGFSKKGDAIIALAGDREFEIKTQSAPHGWQITRASLTGQKAADRRD